MKNMEKKFNTFYGSHVVLSKTEKSSLFHKKNLNVKRLKEGLKEYNEERDTNYKLAEEALVQGSVAMSTVTQNEANNYDIDVAIIFEKDNLPEGTTATKNMIVNALKRKCKGFNVPPTAHTNCVRIEYKDGYHLDFAIYRRFKNSSDDTYTYEHCGSEWRKRDPRAITTWFNEDNKEKEYRLREVVRLLKMFSKSRDFWVNMPGGLIQSVLASEQFQSYTRMDECFYYTIKSIRDRLVWNKEVYNPTDSNSSLKLASKDNTKMENLYNRLNGKLEHLDVLFDDDCTDHQAIEAWELFFNHSYWTDEKEKLTKAKESIKFAASMKEERVHRYRETEEYISHMFPVNLNPLISLDLDCKVENGKGNTIGFLKRMMAKHQVLQPNYNLYFKASSNVTGEFQIYWKVKNRGEVAKKEDRVRGEISRTDSFSHYEATSFKGNHYVECYIVQKGSVVAKKRIEVPIRIS
jgi:hypothetical protein